MVKRFMIIFVAVLAVFITAQITLSQVDRTTKDDLYGQIELFSFALTTVQSEYADEPKPKDLIYGALKGMLGSLDAHSQFLEPEDYKELKTETQGKFGGIGIEISIRDGLLTVVTPLEDTPAWKAGIKAGDRIVKIENEVTKDLTLNDAVKKLRGKPGTEVHITILREDEFKLHDFTLTREVIHIQDVKDPMVLQDNIAYIRLTEFREDSAKEIRANLDKLKEQGADSLILDLRNNPGGLLNVANKITEEFLPAGKLIVSTKGRHPSENTETKSTNMNAVFTHWPMVVMINEGSASGSEILAGALQDNKRAIILGTKSFGKGSVQSVIPMPDGSGLRLTTSKYFTPSGKSIHGTGITPDVEVKREYKKKDEESKEEKDVERIFENIKTEEQPKDNKTENPTENKSETVGQAEQPKDQSPSKGPKTKEDEARQRLLDDNQVQSAINVIKGIKVFQHFDKQTHENAEQKI